MLKEELILTKTNAIRLLQAETTHPYVRVAISKVIETAEKLDKQSNES